MKQKIVFRAYIPIASYIMALWVPVSYGVQTFVKNV